MEPSTSPYHVVLLTTGFRVPERRLFLPHARLYFDRIELSGWHPSERFEQVVYLHEVEHIDWDPAVSELEDTAPNVVFSLSDGRTLPLRLDQRASWRHTLEHRLSWPDQQAAA